MGKLVTCFKRDKQERARVSWLRRIVAAVTASDGPALVVWVTLQWVYECFTKVSEDDGAGLHQMC